MYTQGVVKHINREACNEPQQQNPYPADANRQKQQKAYIYKTEGRAVQDQAVHEQYLEGYEQDKLDDI